MGCEMGQGFLLGRPSPPDDIKGLLNPGAASLGDGPGEVHIADRRTGTLVP